MESGARRSGASWQQVSPPSVLHLFARPSFERLLERSGFELVDWRPISKWVGVGTVLTQVGGKLPGALGRGFGALGRSRAVRPFALPYRLGDLVMAVAKRRR